MPCVGGSNPSIATRTKARRALWAVSTRSQGLTTTSAFPRRSACALVNSSRPGPVAWLRAESPKGGSTPCAVRVANHRRPIGRRPRIGYLLGSRLYCGRE